MSTKGRSRVLELPQTETTITFLFGVRLGSSKSYWKGIDEGYLLGPFEKDLEKVLDPVFQKQVLVGTERESTASGRD